MKTLWVRWEVTEVHSAEIEVEDDFDPDADDFYWSAFLAGYEGDDSYDSTPERDLLEYDLEGEDSCESSA